MEKWIEPHKGNILHQELQSVKEMQMKSPMRRVSGLEKNNITTQTSVVVKLKRVLKFFSFKVLTMKLWGPT